MENVPMDVSRESQRSTNTSEVEESADEQSNSRDVSRLLCDSGSGLCLEQQLNEVLKINKKWKEDYEALELQYQAKNKTLQTELDLTKEKLATAETQVLALGSEVTRLVDSLNDVYTREASPLSPMVDMESYEIFKQQIELYKEDFSIERRDRERAQCEKDSLQQKLKDAQEVISTLTQEEQSNARDVSRLPCESVCGHCLEQQLNEVLKINKKWKEDYEALELQYQAKNETLQTELSLAMEKLATAETQVLALGSEVTRLPDSLSNVHTREASLLSPVVDMGNYEIFKPQIQLYKEDCSIIERRAQCKKDRLQQKLKDAQEVISTLTQEQGSLADEIVTGDKEKIINTLRNQEEENRRLQGYLDGLLMMIMEHNPSLLELQ